MMATPALRALKTAHPQAEIVFEARAFIRELVDGLPTVDAFLEDDGRGVLSRAARLRRERFDWAVLLPDSARAAAAPFLARIPVRVGYARDPLRRALLTRSLEPPSVDGKRVPVSMIERYLRLTRELGCADAGEELDVAIDESTRSAVRARLEAAGMRDAAGYVVVTPGANFGASKLWPAEHFAEACDRLARELGLRTVLAPGPGEEPIVAAIAERMQEKPVALVDPVTGLAALAALIDDARLLLTNDTGPRHIAVACGTPVVVVMGPTDPRHTAHLLERQRVLREDVDCSPCHLKVCPIDHRCMTRLSPERVVRAGEELLS
ncbi:MAG: lipopolysaccharide heptosyltransferase II [Deltaproteobacteria bacterium]|nr:lipopolysaccharide heptosyltransferase II [Deltaproteobacteria bacterium]MBW2414074.1 lipopolysaccharide heptosyltransferase II [Deltaproteobacteria bacterium]